MDLPSRENGRPANQFPWQSQIELASDSNVTATVGIGPRDNGEGLTLDVRGDAEQFRRQASGGVRWKRSIPVRHILYSRIFAYLIAIRFGGYLS
jgi:hypothetical protein